MSTPKTKRQPPAREFDKYFATFQSDPLEKSIGLKSVNPLSWKQFGPILSSSSGYIEFFEEPNTGSTPGGNSHIKKIGFDFTFDGVVYKDFIASPHGWLALLDPTSIPTSSIDVIYNDRFLISGSSSYDNSSIKQAFTKDDLFLAPWFDRLMMTHGNLDTFVSFFSGSSPSLRGKKENFLLGKENSKDQPYNENNFGMKYAIIDDSIDGKTLVIRWSSMGYEYRGIKLAFEAALYQNGKIEFGYAPLDSYSTQYTLISLSEPINVWKLDESSGSTTIDSQGNKNLTYKTPSSMLPATGKINTAAFFSGSASTVIYADQPVFANYAVTDSFSFSAWFKSAVGDSSTKCIFSRMYYDYSKGYTFELAGGYLRLTMAQTFNTNALRVSSTTDPYNDGAWHHVVVTYDGTASSAGVKIYVDGQQITTTASLTSLTTSSDIQAGSGGADFMIGAIGKYNNNDNRFTGSIDDVARWNSVLTSTDVNLLYTQGVKSVSAADIDPIGDSTTSYATCGIFASGTSNWNYRDFAPLLGVVTSSRRYSEYGGALYTGSYFDIDSETSVTASYAVNLGINNWPKHGGKIIFSPPQRRRQLIRSDAHLRENRQLFNNSAFDDRKTINYTDQSNVDASTILPIDALVRPNYPGIHLKQNLISQDGLRLPSREIISAGHVNYVEDETYLLQKSEPFNEDAISINELGDEFFLTGSVSSFGQETNSFARSTACKKKIKLSFSVDKKIKMLTSASSLYYFNVSSNQWNIPTASLKDQVSSSFFKLSVSTTDVGGTCNGSLYLEDKIGFDSQGNAIVSGNLDIFRSTSGNVRNQSTNDVGALFNLNNHAELLMPEYSKSIQRNNAYAGSNDECFTVDITDPFLVEKAVVEIPFCMGDGWFSDRTTLTFVSASNFSHTASGGGKTQMTQLAFLDEGGPAITVSLFCQRNHGTGSVRDLVFKSTFTHTDDESKTVSFSNIGVSGSNDLIHVAALLGNENNQNIISNFVPYQTIGSKKQFTGSVLIKANSAISNCANVANVRIFTSQNTNTGSLLTQFESFLNSEFTSVTNVTSPLERLNYLLNFDTFGRAMSGFGAGAGGEFITSKDVLFGSNVRNPFYTTGSLQRQTITGSLKTQIDSLGTGSLVYCVSKVPLGSQKQMPYIIYPGDKFILAAAKTRPAISSPHIRIDDNSLSTGKIASVISSSYYNNISNDEGHEVFFNTGSIKITLYGSEVKQGGELQ